MQGAKAYVLPVLAAVVLAGYWLLAPSVDDAPPPADPLAKDGPSSADPPGRGRLDSILGVVGSSPGDLPQEYRDRQRTIVAGALGSCSSSGEPVEVYVILVGAPGVGGAVERVEPKGDVPGEVEDCASRTAASLELSAPPTPGRSTLELKL